VNSAKGMSITIWHPVDGYWHQLIQISKGNTREYYTNGVLERVETLNPDGSLKKSVVKVKPENKVTKNKKKDSSNG